MAKRILDTTASVVTLLVIGAVLGTTLVALVSHDIDDTLQPKRATCTIRCETKRAKFEGFERGTTDVCICSFLEKVEP